MVHDTERAGTGASRPGRGAGQPWALGWIEVLSWPGLETIYANRELLSEEVHTGFDPTGRYLALMHGDRGIADLETGRHVLVEGHWVNRPVWDAAGRLIVMHDGGTVAALDPAGVERQRWTEVGDYIVGTRDGSTVAVNCWGDPPIGQVGVFTVLRTIGRSRWHCPRTCWVRSSIRRSRPMAATSSSPCATAAGRSCAAWTTQRLRHPRLRS